MDEQVIFGFHSNFFYCGIAHAIVNMYEYIKAGVDRGEYIYLFMEPDLHSEIIKKLSDAEKKHIGFLPINDLILQYREYGKSALRNSISHYVEQTLTEGYQGVRIIKQPSFEIQQTSKEDFLNFEDNLTDAISGLNISVMCIYDFDDFINNRHYIDEQVISKSFNTHTHKLYQFNLQHII